MNKYLLGWFFLLCLLFSTSVKAEGDGKRLHIISYNIWNGFEKDATRKARFIDWVKSQNPDIVALEELVGFKTGDLEELAKTYGHPYVAMVKENGYPVGITSRYPIEVVTKQVKGLWHGMLHVKTCGLDVVVTHLSPFEWKYRLEEANKITRYIQENQLDSCLVMGDFNAYSAFDADEVEKHVALKKSMTGWDASQKTYRNMRGNQFDYSVLSTFYAAGMVDACRMHTPLASDRMSFPTAFYKKWEHGDKRLADISERLDYILISSSLADACIQGTVYRIPETEGISDHYPVGITLLLR